MFSLVIICLCVAKAVCLCSDDLDCSLLGTCGTDKLCRCKSGWTGASCSRANLESLDITRGYQNRTASSWGGRPIQTKDGKWHLFATEIANKCPLILFEQNSMVVRAESISEDPDGPYYHVETVLPPFHHNPTIIGPTPDDMFLLFFIGANNASNVLDCEQGVPPGSHQVQVPSNNYITMAWTKDPVRGPWQQRVILDDIKGNQSSWHCESQNPTAFVLPNSTVALVYRANNCDRNKATFGEHLGVAVASHWSQKFVRDPEPIVSPQSKMTNGSNNEDAFLWHDGVDESWHLVNHQQGQNNVCGNSYKQERGHSCGAHFFAKNIHGPWHLSTDYVYSENVTLKNGSSAQFKTRQRPQLIFNKDGSPSYLITSGSFEGNNPDLNMTTHTYFQAFSH